MINVLPYAFAAMIVGVLVAAQPPLNGILARSTGNPYGATLVAIFVALLVMGVITIFMGRGDLSLANLRSVPWWVYLSSVAGALFVLAGAAISPVTGGLLFFVCIVAGQLLGAMLMDHFGAFGLAVREVTLWRVTGFALVLGGAVMVLRG